MYLVFSETNCTQLVLLKQLEDLIANAFLISIYEWLTNVFIGKAFSWKYDISYHIF